MRGSIRCLILGALALAALRQGVGWRAATAIRPAIPLWAALSFALAAVVDTDRKG